MIKVTPELTVDGWKVILATGVEITIRPEDMPPRGEGRSPEWLMEAQAGVAYALDHWPFLHPKGEHYPIPTRRVGTTEPRRVDTDILIYSDCSAYVRATLAPEEDEVWGDWREFLRHYDLVDLSDRVVSADKWHAYSHETGE